MADISSQNPLLEPQREKVGADTFSKYGYQYHWALYRLLTEHENSRDYAVFVELHEDVVLSKSLDSTSAKFEFNQVKTTSGKFTVNKLTKLKNNQSVLGKLIGSCINKKYSSFIDEIRFVATSGFEFQLKKDGIDLEVIRITDIAKDDINSIEQKLKSELVCDRLPSTLHFIIPNLPIKGFQQNITGQISELISNLFPNAECNSVNIYRALYDEITRKGAVTYDYVLWDELLKKKAITSTTVSKLIEQNVSSKSETAIEIKFNEISAELGHKVLQKERLHKEFNRYRQKRIGDRTSLQLETSNSIKSLIDNSIGGCNDDIGQLIQMVNNSLSEKIKSQFANDLQVTGAILCEYIMQNKNV